MEDLKSKKIDKTDWECFRKVLVDNTLLKDENLQALKRLSIAVEDYRILQVINELLDSVTDTTTDPTLEDLEISVRLYNLLKKYAEDNGQLKTCRQVIRKMAEKGQPTSVFLRLRNAGMGGLRELAAVIQKIHPDLYSQYFE